MEVVARERERGADQCRRPRLHLRCPRLAGDIRRRPEFISPPGLPATTWRGPRGREPSQLESGRGGDRLDGESLLSAPSTARSRRPDALASTSGVTNSSEEG